MHDKCYKYHKLWDGRKIDYARIITQLTLKIKINVSNANKEE